MKLLAEGLVTASEAARLKGTTVDALRLWLKRHPEVPRQAIGRVIVVRYSELDSYNPRLK